jgi:hypothetical protein
MFRGVPVTGHSSAGAEQRGRWDAAGDAGGVLEAQVYYGEWRGQEVAVKIVDADKAQQSLVLQEARVVLQDLILYFLHPQTLFCLHVTRRAATLIHAMCRAF